MKKAIIFGSTGFVGSCLLKTLLNEAAYEQVTVVVRKALSTKHPKLKVLIGDFNSLPALKDQIVCDEVFIALGTTKKLTPDRAQYYQVEHDYPVLAAKISKECGATSVFLVTAVGANANSSVFYVKSKGETERDVIALDFQHTHIFRPSMIMGQRQEHRPLEGVLIQLWGAINPIFAGPLSHYRGIDGKHVAEAMHLAAAHQSDRVKIYHWREMSQLLTS